MNSQNWFKLIHSYCLSWILRVVSVLLRGKFTSNKLDKPFWQDQKIIEIAKAKVRFAEYCNNLQANNYLGLLTKEITTKKEVEPYNFLVDKYFSLKRNNADVLILSESEELKRIWSFNEYKHTQYIGYAPINLTALLVGLPGLLKNTVFRRIKVMQVLIIEDDLGIKQPILLIKILKRVTPNARRFISPLLGVTDFFATLNQKQVSYAILRWFEDLPLIMPGEDIDMLVADKDIEKIEFLLSQQPGIIPCDLYTVSGLPGTAYKNMAYYPPFLAEQILAGAIAFKDIFAVPNPEIHFYSLAYHAIYHKGLKSGIPWSLEAAKEPKLNPEHEYQAILENMANSLGIKAEITLQGLDDFLASINWRPSEDTLARLDSSQIWLTAGTKPSVEIEPAIDIKGLAVFFIRQKALELNLEADITALLIKEGFNLITSQVLDSEAAKRVKYQVRGGNWGKGPWSESGGDPAMVLVAIDLMPVQPTPIELARQPHLSNGRIVVKNTIRDTINQSLPPEQQCNTVHSSDNEREAWNYLEIALPEQLEEIQQKISQLHSDFATNHAIKQVLTRFGRRAKVEIIEYDRQLAVKKTFRPGCEKFFEREVLVSQSFAQDCLTIPSLLDVGANYLIYPYYDDLLRFQNRQSKLLPLAIAKQAIATLKFFYDQDYALIDFQPANIIVDRTLGLKVIDFEFLYHYQTKPESFEQCYELAGIPPDFEGDKPDFRMEMSYVARWQPYVGLSLNSLLYDPVWLQQIKRFGFAITHFPLRLLKNRLKAVLWAKKLNLKQNLSTPIRQ
jgi:hypothetical protein